MFSLFKKKNRFEPDQFDLEILRIFLRRNPNGISLPTLDRDLIGKYDVEFCNEHHLIGVKLGKRLDRLVEHGYLCRTEYAMGFALSREGLKFIEGR